MLRNSNTLASNGVGEPCDRTVVAATMSQLSLKAIDTADFPGEFRPTKV
jgi:hypothetical protein